jgi:hypothetical protein
VGPRPLLMFTSALRATAVLPRAALDAAEAALHAQL